MVIGGDAAGMSAASQARRRRPVGDLRIVAFEKGRHVSYSACGIPYLIAGDVAGPDDLVARTPAEFRKLDIDLRLGSEVVAISVDRREVTVRSGADSYAEPFDQLVIATGGVPARPDVPGVDAAGIHGVQTLEDGIRILEFLESDRPRRAVVVGAGYIGLEMAEAMISRGLEVALIDAADQPMRTLDPDMAVLVADALRGLGVDLRLSCALKDSTSPTAGSPACAPPARRCPRTSSSSASAPAPTANSPPTRASPSARPAASPSTAACAPPPRASGPPATASRSST